MVNVVKKRRFLRDGKYANFLIFIFEFAFMPFG
jgi:hypothetical protein